jgi:hypothetical protein
MYSSLVRFKQKCYEESYECASPSLAEVSRLPNWNLH